nr:hypothetical protein Iba_chr10fCG4520 [Ipomoea batatas]
MPAVLIASGISSSWEEFSSITSNEGNIMRSTINADEMKMIGEHVVYQCCIPSFGYIFGTRCLIQIKPTPAASPTSNPQKIEQWLFGDHHLTQPSRIEQSHHQLACSSSRSQSPFSYHVLRYPAPHSMCPLLAEAAGARVSDEFFKLPGSLERPGLDLPIGGDRIPEPGNACSAC